MQASVASTLISNVLLKSFRKLTTRKDAAVIRAFNLRRRLTLATYVVQFSHLPLPAT